MKCKPGENLVKGVCVKKNYNPFKMWGSYVGAVFSVFYFGGPAYDKIHNLLVLFGPLAGLAKITYIIIFIILGFLVGWGVHSIIRYLRK